MPGDPKECREHAKNCMRLASEANTERARDTFTDLARTWTRLATDLENAEALLDEWGGSQTTKTMPNDSRRPSAKAWRH
jgi:hypothetical protein